MEDLTPRNHGQRQAVKYSGNARWPSALAIYVNGQGEEYPLFTRYDVEYSQQVVETIRQERAGTPA